VENNPRRFKGEKSPDRTSHSHRVGPPVHPRAARAVLLAAFASVFVSDNVHFVNKRFVINSLRRHDLYVYGRIMGCGHVDFRLLLHECGVLRCAWKCHAHIDLEGDAVILSLLGDTSAQ
jgi:hypothetical protein